MRRTAIPRLTANHPDTRINEQPSAEKSRLAKFEHQALEYSSAC